MPTAKAPQSLSPGQAQYVVSRLIAERRISPGEVARYVGEIQRDITDIEARLARLREASGDTQVGHARAHPPMQAATGRSSRTSRTRRQQRVPRRDRADGKALGGMYGGLIRRVPKAEQRRYKKIKANEGIAAAIAALRERRKRRTSI